MAISNEISRRKKNTGGKVFHFPHIPNVPDLDSSGGVVKVLLAETLKRGGFVFSNCLHDDMIKIVE